jgi:cold shock CspA family protein
MMAYVDHHGNITDTPPDPKLKVELKLEDIQLGAKVEEAADPHSKLRKGRVILYKDDKGYGFIKDSITKEQIFFHLSSMVTEARQGDMVEYELGKGPKGIVALGVTKTL